jgi:hypothetical protein
MLDKRLFSFPFKSSVSNNNKLYINELDVKTIGFPQYFFVGIQYNPGYQDRRPKLWWVDN